MLIKNLLDYMQNDMLELAETGSNLDLCGSNIFNFTMKPAYQRGRKTVPFHKQKNQKLFSNKEVLTNFP